MRFLVVEDEKRIADFLSRGLESAGYALPNNCRAGACGECKVKVLEGQFDQGFVLDMALSQDERGQGLFFVTVPIASNDGSKRLLSAGVDIDGLSAVFGEAGQPTEWTSAVVDRNGVFLARSKSSQDFVGRLARPQVAKAALRVEVSGVFDNVTYEGVAVSNSFSRSALSGWTSVIAVPTSILEAPMRRSMTLLGWASLASIVASLALAGYAARQIAEPVNGLSAAAEALAAGQSMREPLHRIQEFDAVWTALQRAEAVAQERVRYHAMLAEATVEEFRQKLVVKQALADLEYSERRYRTAMSVGRMGSWETDFDAGIRQWSDEGMSLFGLNLSDGKGVIGGGTDEYVASLHPDDRKLVQQFHLLADHQDEFDAEYRVVRPDGRMLWVAGRGHVAERRPDGSARRLVSIVSDITERKAAEEKIHFLMRELSHRSKNLLAVVQSLAKQTARSSGTFDEFVRRFGDRLQGLAASHDLLVKGDWADAPLGELVSMQLAPFAASLMGQIEMEGPVVPLSAEAAQSIGLALHELATNALKYGALSVPMGKLSVTWWQSNVEGRPVVVLNWCERNGPPVVQPGGKGFGSAVIEGMVARSMNGKVVLDFAPGGLDWTLSFPAPPHSTAA